MQFTDLNADVLGYIASIYPSPELSSTNRRMHKFVNQMLTSLARQGINPLNASPTNTTLTYQDFARLVSGLRREAGRLGSPQPDLSALSTSERMLWGYYHFRELIETVALRTQQVKEEDFVKLVRAVADILALPPFSDQDCEQVWKSIQDTQLDQIEELNLASQNLRFVPPEIGRLKRLKSLFLDHNQLTSLPSEINSFNDLEKLKLNHNQLTEIPDDVRLPNLQRLELRYNQLTKMPNVMAYPNLTALYLHHNKIEHIPDEIYSHPTLAQVYLRDNPIINKEPATSRVIVEDMQIDSNPLQLQIGDRVEDY